MHHRASILLSTCVFIFLQEWTKDRKRCNVAGVPRKIQFRTCHDLALEMLDQHGPLLMRTLLDHIQGLAPLDVDGRPFGAPRKTESLTQKGNPTGEFADLPGAMQECLGSWHPKVLQPSR